MKNKFQSKMFANEAVWAQFQFCSICILFLASYKASLYLDGCLNDLYDNAVAFSYHGCFYGRLSSLSWHRGEEGTFCHFFSLHFNSLACIPLFPYGFVVSVCIFSNCLLFTRTWGGPHGWCQPFGFRYTLRWNRIYWADHIHRNDDVGWDNALMMMM